MTLALIQIGKALKNDAIDAVTCAMAAIIRGFSGSLLPSRTSSL